MKLTRLMHTAGLCLLLTTAGSVFAQQDSAATLDELLKSVRDSGAATESANREREQAFRAKRNEQRQILNETQAAVRAQETRSQQLKSRFDNNEQELEALAETLRIRVGDMGELFGIVRQVGGDTKGIVDNSLITAQIDARNDVTNKLAQATALPSIEDLRELQAILLEEMIESGKVVRFQREIEDASGVARATDVVRIGVFNVVNENGYLTYDASNNILRELSRQPAARYVNSATEFFDATAGNEALAIDPSGGSLLSLVVRKPSLAEQITYGGTIGYVIIFLAVCGIAVALFRLVSLQIAGAKIARQLKSSEISNNNALGRILSVYEANRNIAVESLELKLDEAIMRETPPLERFHSMIKVLAGIAPLLGLLGTVVGMIRTFQSITLFGTGDPKLMADGISQALVTTAEGLIAAIPLVFLHALLASRSRTLIEILEAQSAGLVARHVEADK